MKASAKIHIIYLSIIVLILMVMAGGFFYFKRNYHTQVVMGMSAGQGMLPPGGKSPNGKRGMGAMMGMGMAIVTPPALSDQQQQQLVSGAGTTSTQKTFNITAGNYYFVPNKITVNKGDNVTFVMTNAGGLHNLVIDELQVKTPLIKTGEAASVTFTASKVGTYIYYCTVKGHKEKGMFGTLIVQ